jgi:hypothetical protein
MVMVNCVLAPTNHGALSVGAATGGVEPQQKLQAPNVIELASASFQLLALSAFKPPEPLSLVMAVSRLAAESV